MDVSVLFFFVDLQNKHLRKLCYISISFIFISSPTSSKFLHIYKSSHLAKRFSMRWIRQPLIALRKGIFLWLSNGFTMVTQFPNIQVRVASISWICLQDWVPWTLILWGGNTEAPTLVASVIKQGKQKPLRSWTLTVIIMFARNSLLLSFISKFCPKTYLESLLVSLISIKKFPIEIHFNPST